VNNVILRPPFDRLRVNSRFMVSLSNQESSLQNIRRRGSFAAAQDDGKTALFTKLEEIAQQAFSVHLGRLRDAHDLEDGGGDIGEDAGGLIAEMVLVYEPAAAEQRMD